MASNQTIENWDNGAVRTPFTEDTNPRTLYEDVSAIQSQPYSNWDTFKESANSMLKDTTLGVMQRHADIDNSRRTTDFTGKSIFNPMLSREEANLKYGKYGVTFNRDIRQNEADIIAAKKIREDAQRARLQQTNGDFMSGASSLLGGFAGAMLDPINIATAFIPVTKLMPALKGLEAAGFWGKTAVKGIDGLVMNSLVEPLPLWAASIDQRDYKMTDSLMNVTAGGLFGAGIGAFTEGVRALTAGEKFNAGIAASVDFANGRGLDNTLEFQRRNPSITSLAYDDLVSMPNERLHVTQEGKQTLVRLAEDGPLSRITGYGDNIETAKANLRRQVGALLEDDNIFNGYRIDDSLDNFYNALREAGHLDNAQWLPKWLDTLQNKAYKEGMSLQDYLAKQTNNFTDFNKIIKRAGQSKSMQHKFGELSGDALDDAIEHGAGMIDSYAKLKDAFAANPRNKIDYQTFIGDLREHTHNTQQLANEQASRELHIKQLQEEYEASQKLLDNRELTIDREELTRKINDLNASIEAHKTYLNEFNSKNGELDWRVDADNIELLEAMRSRLEQDPRTFDDVREQLSKQTEENKSWDTKDSILDDILLTKQEVNTSELLATLNEDIAVANESLKYAVNKFSKDELRAMKFTKEGISEDMARAERKIQETDELIKEIDNYAICRQTEVV